MSPSEFFNLKGFNSFDASKGEMSSQHLQEMQEIGASCVRIWCVPKYSKDGYAIDVDQEDRLLIAVSMSNKVGVHPIICVGVPTEHMPFGDNERALAFLEMWKSMAVIFQDHSVSYDLLNEPAPKEGFGEGTHHSYEQTITIANEWRDLAIAISSWILSYDKEKVCVVQMGLNADPVQFSRQRPIFLPNVVHSAHFYTPYSYTHRGVHKDEKLIPMNRQERAEMRNSLMALADWSRRHNLPIFIGETSAHNVLPDASSYINMVTAFFNANGWPWCYHDWRQWQGWHPTPRTIEILSHAFSPL